MMVKRRPLLLLVVASLSMALASTGCRPQVKSYEPYDNTSGVTVGGRPVKEVEKEYLAKLAQEEKEAQDGPADADGNEGDVQYITSGSSNRSGGVRAAGLPRGANSSNRSGAVRTAGAGNAVKGSNRSGAVRSVGAGRATVGSNRSGSVAQGSSGRVIRGSNRSGSAGPVVRGSNRSGSASSATRPAVTPARPSTGTNRSGSPKLPAPGSAKGIAPQKLKPSAGGNRSHSLNMPGAALKNLFAQSNLDTAELTALYGAAVPVAEPVPAPAATVAVAGKKSDPLDWPFWRGPEGNNVSRETGLIDDFKPEGGPGSNVAWKRDDLGSRSTPIVMNGKLYLQCRAKPGTAQEGERIVCLDAATGKTLWENRWNVYHSAVPDTRVAWPAPVGDPTTGHVYVLGVCGLFMCIDGETGKTVWSIPMHEQYGLLSTYGGRTNFPVICDDLVIISGVIIGWGEMAKPAHRFVAFNKLTGEPVWFTGTKELPEDTTYSTPSINVIDGRKLMIFGSSDGGVWALEPRTGRTVWNYYISKRGINTSPTVDGNIVYIGHSEENLVGTQMGGFFAFDARQKGKVAPLWEGYELMVGRSSPLLVDGRIYVVDDGGKMFIVDPKNGQPLFPKKGLDTMMWANLLYADGKIYAFSTNGRWYIFTPDEAKGVKEVKKGRLPNGENVHGSPIVSHGRLYLTTTGALYCLVDENKKPGATEIPAQPKETPVAESDKAVWGQVVPVEAVVAPGEKLEFRMRLFNERGQFLREDKITGGTVTGAGTVEGGAYTAPAEGFAAAALNFTGKEGLTGSARVRVIPPLPWKIDFEAAQIDPMKKAGEPPLPWIGVRYRSVIREKDGSKVLVKVTTIPKGTRSQGFFGRSDMHDYTIQADVSGQTTGGQMPDVGVNAQGYTLELQGNHQKLQLRSWQSHDFRNAKTVPFAWKADTWYTMKLQAANEGKNAVLKGKVWPRGEKEPEAWTVEVIDDEPQTYGAPGMFGNANVCELYIDNILVAPNK